MTTLFLISGAVQYNDPDGLLWMSIYGAAAVITGLFVVQKLGWSAAAIATAAAFLGAGIIGMEAAREGAIASAFDTWQMQSVSQEKVREAGGLLVIGLWMLTVTLRIRKTGNSPEQVDT